MQLRDFQNPTCAHCYTAVRQVSIFSRVLQVVTLLYVVIRRLGDTKTGEKDGLVEVPEERRADDSFLG